MEKLREALEKFGMQFGSDVTESQKKELEDFWNSTFEKEGDAVGDAEKQAVLSGFRNFNFVIDKPDIPRFEPVYGEPVFTLSDGRERNHVFIGKFTNPDGRLMFECRTGEKPELCPVYKVDVRFQKLLLSLMEEHAFLRLDGYYQGETFAVTGIHRQKDPEDREEPDDSFLQTLIHRLQSSQVFPQEEAPEEERFETLEGIKSFVKIGGITLPGQIRHWAERTLKELEDPSVSAEEKNHAKRALMLMLNVRWESTDFPPIDPWEARKILDEELYGLENVKQRVIETIIQINRTHTLPAYGLLLIGPPGTGKSRIAYAVGKILKLPCTVLDMSTIRDPEALTGSPRVYVNAKPGKIMEAFSRAGTSNIVFAINELDKADGEHTNGNPGDVLLTLLDNLGFTDVYMECAIPTGGVYPIGTANDKSKISGPLLSRFSVIEIPDYTPEEKKIIFTQYALPRVLKKVGMSKKECVLTDGAVDCVIRRFQGYTGCRELEQAAEHIAGNALYRIETERVAQVIYDERAVERLLTGKNT